VRSNSQLPVSLHANWIETTVAAIEKRIESKRRLEMALYPETENGKDVKSLPFSFCESAYGNTKVGLNDDPVRCSLIEY